MRVQLTLHVAGGSVGYTNLCISEIRKIIDQMKTAYPAGSYNIIHNNRHHFWNDVLAKMGLPLIDERFTRTPRAVENIARVCPYALFGTTICGTTTTGIWILWDQGR